MRKAILVIHGFVGTLYDNEYLTNYLNLDRKFDVFAKTLPGHHTNDNYQKVEYSEWLKFVDSWVEEIINYGYKSIYVIGHSMGGILAGHLASKYSQIKKVVFLNAAFHYLNFKQNKVDIVKNKDYKDYLEVLTRVIHTTIPFFLEFTKLVKDKQSCLNKITCDALVLQSSSVFAVAKSRGAHFWALFVCRFFRKYNHKTLLVKQLEMSKYITI